MDNQLNDLMVRTLRKEGYQGQLNQMMSAWLRGTGANGNDLPDLWLSFLLLQPGDQRNQKEANWLRGLGFTQPALPDQQHAYWKDRALTP